MRESFAFSGVCIAINIWSFIYNIVQVVILVRFFVALKLLFLVVWLPVQTPFPGLVAFKQQQYFIPAEQHAVVCRARPTTTHASPLAVGPK